MAISTSSPPNNASDVEIVYNNGDGTFAVKTDLYEAGQFPVAVAVADFGKWLPDEEEFVIGEKDDYLDLIVANNGLAQPLFSGPAELVILPGGVEQLNGESASGTPFAWRRLKVRSTSRWRTSTATANSTSSPSIATGS